MNDALFVLTEPPSRSGNDAPIDTPHPTQAVVCKVESGDPKEDRKRAYLIAAAPELYEWLFIIDGVMRESAGIYGFHLNGEIMKWSELDPAGRISEILAKARGEAVA